MTWFFIRRVSACLAIAWGVAWGQAPSPAQQAKAAFDKVDSSPLPALQDVMRCMQTHSALLPLVPADQRYLVHYRLGYCALFAAVVTKDPADYGAAAREFGLSRECWPQKPSSPSVSSGLLAITGIAQTGAASGRVPSEALRNLETAVQQSNCSDTALMQTGFCRELIDAARLWLGWAAIESGRLNDAAPFFGAVPGSPWSEWLAGRQAWAARRWRASVSSMERAAEAWRTSEKNAAPTTLTLLGPRLDPGRAYYEIGVSYYRLEDYAQALAALNTALQANPSNAYALFLRARSKDALGQSDALADYQGAVNTANQAQDTSWAVGQAHYYRGLLLYKAKQFKDAETAFASAPAASLGDMPLQHVTGWRSLAAVAGGDCTRVPELLEATAQLASTGFPVAEAGPLAFACQLQQASTLDQLLQLQERSGGKLPLAQARELHVRIAEAYAAQGVSAEDRNDVNAALLAYRKALDWDPASSKARFNLGAIYLEDKKYLLAEEQYRALSQAHPDDYEAQYWLAESILAQPLSPARKGEACELLQRSLSIPDTTKRAQFSKALESVKCR